MGDDGKLNGPVDLAVKLHPGKALDEPALALEFGVEGEEEPQGRLLFNFQGAVVLRDKLTAVLDEWLRTEPTEGEAH